MQIVQASPGVLYLICAVFMSAFPGLYATSHNSLIFEDYVYRDNIKTVRMHAIGWEMSYPVIELESDDVLIFSFDDLDADVKNYQYRIIHCNADWTRSSLIPSDYMDGFFENQIDNYRFSFNTFVSFTHYSLTIPNFDVSPRLPGNYILKVYEDFDVENVVLTRRFMINDPVVTIQARVHRPRQTKHYHTGQQLTFSIFHTELNITDPHSELFVTVMQNGRTDNSLKGINPMFIRSHEIVYEHDQKLIFPAGNEFRNFDTKSLRSRTEFIRNIEFSGGINHVELQTSDSRQYSRYFSHHDINGRYLIRNEEGRNPSIDADYVMVWFTLPWDVPFDNGNVYILGQLGDWNFHQRNRMKYNYDNKAYELGMLLKQGYYNYHFAFLEEGASEADITIFEGNFFETENDYFIKVYHRPPGSRIDRLVGAIRVNSRN